MNSAGTADASKGGMTADSIFLVLGLALVVDAAFGYSDVVYRKIGHPVTWIGAMISAADKHFNRQDASFAVRKAVGAVALGAIVGGAALVAALVQGALAQAPGGVIVLAIVAATLIAARSLYDHVRNVAAALEGEGIEGGRRSVAMIVGRDTAALDESGVARAAIESLAENASDGVVAPAFWFAVAGLPGLAAYKAINTADSMIGHRTARHEAFGWAAAGLDDLVNLPASRLTGLLFALAGYAMSDATPRAAFAAMRRDASKHRSPNAGWPESAMAGAMTLKLNGPRVYDGEVVNDAYMGDGRREATSNDIRRALKLSSIAWLLLALLVVALWLIARA